MTYINCKILDFLKRFSIFYVLLTIFFILNTNTHINIFVLFSFSLFFYIYNSYVARIDENSPQGTALVFSDPYVARVYDDDTGKNGVFSLTLLGNNGTFEISPNVAERRASFLIRVRDNQLLDYEMRHSVEFQVNLFFFHLLFSFRRVTFVLCFFLSSI